MFGRRPKHKHIWGNWYPCSDRYADVRRCETCGRREKKGI